MYKQLDDAAYTDFRKALLAKGHTELRREFLQAAQSNEQFSAYVRTEHKIGTEGEDDLPMLDERFSEEEYKQPPIDTEERIFKPWASIPPKVACRPAFWAEAPLQHIENGNIQATFLAAGASTAIDGSDRLSSAISEGNEKEIEECVRSILRRMGGLPEARGNISTYVNCPFACAWWRMRWATEVHENTSVPVVNILKLFSLKQEYWENLVRFVVSRNSVLGDQNVRDALIWFLTEKLQTDTTQAILRANNLRALCRILGIRCAWQELGALEILELKNIVDEEVRQMISVSSG